MATLARTLVDELAAELGGSTPARVRQLHLPGRIVAGRKDAEFGALELDDGSVGLCFLLLPGTLEGLGPERRAALAGADPLALARRWADPDSDPPSRAIGFAALLALTRMALDRAGIEPPPAADSLGGLDPPPGSHVGMVGLFPPLVSQVLARGARLSVLELRADLAAERDRYTVSLAPEALDTCDRIVCTAATLLNHTLEPLLDRWMAGRQPRVALVGPGAGAWPPPLWRRGVDTLAGTWITDGAGLVAALREDRPWSHAARKFAWRAAQGRALVAR